MLRGWLNYGVMVAAACAVQVVPGFISFDAGGGGPSGEDWSVAMQDERPTGFLTIDYEDYRRQQLRDHLGGSQAPSPDEVLRQTDILLELLDDIGMRATFFCVARMVDELPHSVWERLLAGGHCIGSHGFEHVRVYDQGPRAFFEEARCSKHKLEDALGQPVRSFRAPYFSVDGCEPWYGEMLAKAGYDLDSSSRLGVPPPGFQGTLPLAGSDGQVRLVPLPSIGIGRKRLTVIGGTYFRLLPTCVGFKLLRKASRRGFIPTVYLHPYDLDPAADWLHYPGVHAAQRAGDAMRRAGRRTARQKLRFLCKHFRFQPIESVLH